MDSKIVKDARLADLILKTESVVAAVSNIPGATINSDNVELELSNFGDNASVVLAKFGSEVASITVAGTVATLDFTSAVSASDVIEVHVALDL